MQKTIVMNRFQLTTISLIMLIIISCDKGESVKTVSICGKWAVTDFISIESISYPKKDGLNPVIEFKIDGSYNLKLDVNSCMGNFTFSDPNMISFSASGCTKMCCDSEFSQKFTEMLPRVKTFSMEDRMLKLNIPDWGWIVLEEVK